MRRTVDLDTAKQTIDEKNARIVELEKIQGELEDRVSEVEAERNRLNTALVDLREREDELVELLSAIIDGWDNELPEFAEKLATAIEKARTAIHADLGWNADK